MNWSGMHLPGRRWRWPIMLSLMAHVLLALLFVLTPVPVDGRAYGPPMIDTCEEQELEAEYVTLTLDICDVPAIHPMEEMLNVQEPDPLVALPVATTEPTSTTPEVDVPPADTESQGGEAIPARPFAATKLLPSGASGLTSDAPALFPVPATARSVVYVIDRSGSMGSQGRLALARRELCRSLCQLSDTVRFQIIAYNRRAEPLRLASGGGLVLATAENVRQALALVEELVPEGGTEHLPALRLALLLQPDVIFFLTDADDLKPEEVRTITRLNQGRTTIHVIELTLANQNREDMPMHCLARDNRGTYRAVEP